MNDVNDGGILIGVILGFLVGAIAIGCFSYINTEERLKENTIKACGTCDERTKTCGEFTCTKEGWK